MVLGGREYVGYQYYRTGCRKEVALFDDAEWLSKKETSHNTGCFLFTFSIEMLYYVYQSSHSVQNKNVLSMYEYLYSEMECFHAITVE